MSLLSVCSRCKEGPAKPQWEGVKLGQISSHVPWGRSMHSITVLQLMLNVFIVPQYADHMSEPQEMINISGLIK